MRVCRCAGRCGNTIWLCSRDLLFPNSLLPPCLLHLQSGASPSIFVGIGALTERLDRYLQLKIDKNEVIISVHLTSPHLTSPHKTPTFSAVFPPSEKGAFIICWTPGLVLLLLDVCCPQCDVLAYEKFFLLLAEFNSAMNPIIYSYRDKEMSATFRQILCCQRSENTSGPTEGSDRSASSLNHTILAGVHSNDHSVV
ncbi:Lysophosphatidic acid receptor 1 [Myotis brandtii]|uniref:Lysophosphatidic acid receptor 1 n=1 Tax=Myotis brandtii TaxID=109478 RepID=S7MI97_MYOBR|nr:Lysophosphatidic acid receptor 1 [Myotis brandtii]